MVRDATDIGTPELICNDGFRELYREALSGVRRCRPVATVCHRRLVIVGLLRRRFGCHDSPI